MNQELSEAMQDSGRPAVDTVSGNGRSGTPSSHGAVLLVDDNPAVAGAMEIAFRIAGRKLETANGPEEALSRLASGRFDAVLLDMNFTPGRSDGEEGLALLSRIMAEDPAACVIIITAHSGIRIAVAAMQAGARDFVMKPWRNADLLAKVEAATARGGVTAMPASVPVADPVRLLGDSAAMRRLRDLVRRVGPTPAGVAVTGPAGSGRTLTALAIHAASLHAGGEALRIDMRDDGAWDRLDRASGTVILRHPDRLDPVRQARLLDRLPSHLRCIAVVGHAASLTPALRHRAATVEISVPPLAAREDDAVLLARHFARLAAMRFGRPPMRLTEGAEAAIRETLWDDEVRGLALAMDRAVLLTDADTIDAAAIAPGLATAAALPPAAAGDTGFDLGEAEKHMIEAALREHRHNVTHAAAALGLSRGTLYRRMARHGL